MEPLYAPHGVEERWQRTWEDEGLYRAGVGAPPRRDVRDLRAAAERHRRAAHGPRAERLDPGRADPLAPDARLRHALAAGLRPRRHLDPERGREAARARGHVAQGARPRGVRRARLGSSSTRPAARSWASSAASAPRSTTTASASRWTTRYIEAVMRFFVHLWERGWLYRANRHRQLVHRSTRRRSPTSRSSTSTIDDALTYARYPLRRRRPARSRSRRCGRRRSSPTSRSPCTPTTSATATRSARR